MPVKSDLGSNGVRKGMHREPKIAAESLYFAFVSMLWLDISQSHMLLHLRENARCGEYFTTDRPNKIYCSDEVCQKKLKSEVVGC